MQTVTIKLPNESLTGKLSQNSSRQCLIVVCHGFQSSSDNPTLVAITEGLNKRGHNTFSFTFSANLGGFDIAHQVADIAEVVEYFDAYREVILIGFSFAALTTAIATLKIMNIKGLITLNGFFGTGKLGETYRRNYRKFRLAAMVIPKYRRILLYLKSELQPSSITVPVLVVYSKRDESVHMVQSKKFYAQLKTAKQRLILETANHGVSAAADREKVVSAIHEWLTR